MDNTLLDPVQNAHRATAKAGVMAIAAGGMESVKILQVLINQYETLNPILFSADCKLGEWSGWSTSCSCDERFLIRRKKVLSSEQNRGEACPDHQELRKCDAKGCNGLDTFS